MKKCPVCKGEGRFLKVIDPGGQYRTVVCMVCDGKGEVGQIPPPFIIKVPCPQCEGYDLTFHSEDPPHKHTSCPVCLNRRSVKVRVPRITREAIRA